MRAFCWLLFPITAVLGLSGCFRSDACPDVWAPVCGTDGATYPNTCLADRAGVPVDHAGACVGDPGGCHSDVDCLAGYTCDTTTGTCVECTCDTVYDPVCAADAMTYGNMCEAACARVRVLYPGECAPCVTDPDCTLDETCRLEMFCLVPPGEDPAGRPAPMCDTVSHCVPRECADDTHCAPGSLCDLATCRTGVGCDPSGACYDGCWGTCVPPPGA